MRKDTFTFTGAGGCELHASVWMPEQEPKKVLQVIHGMTEHMGRYEKLAESLTEEGIAVAGFDLRGHGRNPGNPEIAAFAEGDAERSMEDIHQFRQLLSERFGGLPHTMLGFSLGSFLLRAYLEKHSEGLAGAIIMGTGWQPSMVLSGVMTVVKTQLKKAGFEGTTPLVKKLSFETYNQKFAPNRTEADWLCADEMQLDAYLADPLTRQNISAGLFLQLLGLMKSTGAADAYKEWQKDLPVLLLSGQEDPVGDFGKGPLQVEKMMKKAGLTSVETEFYLGGRHDILHEEVSGTAEEVRQRIRQWMR